MPNSEPSPPLLNEIEVSVFGPGYSEAVLIHIGEGKWILVDSCVDQRSELPIPLRYLMGLGIDVGSAVRLIVATHWHDDHIRGISDSFDLCRSAEIVISSALRLKEFRELVAFYGKRSTMKSSGLDEFVRVFELLQDRKQQGVRFNPPKLALADRVVYQDQTQVRDVRVFSLSPPIRPCYKPSWPSQS